MYCATAVASKIDLRTWSVELQRFNFLTKGDKTYPRDTVCQDAGNNDPAWVVVVDIKS